MALGSFQNKAIGIAFLVLVILIILMSIILYRTANQGTYPPVVNECPDYWITSNYAVQEGECKTSEYGCCSDKTTAKTDADGTNCPIKCYNAYKLGKTSSSCSSIPAEMDFSTDEYTGASGTCNKQTWAKNCGITWDGVTDIPTAC